MLQKSQVICDGEACPASDLAKADIVVHGSDTVGDSLFPLLVEGYANQGRSAVAERNEIAADTVHLVVRDNRGRGKDVMTVEVQSAGSSTGFAALAANEAQIAMSSRAPTADEYGAIADQGRGDLEDIN